MIPFPQVSSEWQSALQPSPSVTLPSSQTSPGSITPSPQLPGSMHTACLAAQICCSLQTWPPQTTSGCGNAHAVTIAIETTQIWNAGPFTQVHRYLSRQTHIH